MVESRLLSGALFFGHGHSRPAAPRAVHVLTGEFLVVLIISNYYKVSSTLKVGGKMGQNFILDSKKMGQNFILDSKKCPVSL